MTKFVFDLDGTVTAAETLPIIAKHFDVAAEIDALTEQTVAGNIPFMDSFIRRVFLLGKLPVTEVADLLEKTPLYSKVVEFIAQHREDCFIATGNIDAWVEKLVARIGCTAFCSQGLIVNNNVKKLTRILKKENIVERFKNAGERVVFVGDGNNDMEAMRLADVAIASGLTHYPAKSVLTVADYLIFDEEALCRQLNQLC